MQQLKHGAARCEAVPLVESNMEYLVKECREHGHAE